jgi:hypothetical protein
MWFAYWTLRFWLQRLLGQDGAKRTTATTALASGVHSRTLPFWRTVGLAYAAPFVHSGALLRAARLWFLVLAPPLLVISWYQAPMQAEVLARVGTEPRPVNAPWQLELLILFSQLVLSVPIASIAVAWHRLILNREIPAAVYLRIDRGVWLYTAFLLVMVLSLTALGNLPRLVNAGFGDGVEDILEALSLALWIALMCVLGRLSLTLPAIALGHTDFGLRESWRATEGNTWRLFWGYLLCCFALVLPASLLFRLVGVDRVTATIIQAATGLISILASIVSVGFLSFAYRHLLEGKR